MRLVKLVRFLELVCSGITRRDRDIEWVKKVSHYEVYWKTNLKILFPLFNYFIH